MKVAIPTKKKVGVNSRKYDQLLGAKDECRRLKTSGAVQAQCKRIRTQVVKETSRDPWVAVLAVPTSSRVMNK